MPPRKLLPRLRKAAIEEIAAAPAKVRAALQGLSEAQLETPYREGGWTRAPGGAPSRRQPHERLYSLATGADGNRAHDQALRRSGLGQTRGRRARAGGSFAQIAGTVARTLGQAAAFGEAGRICQDVPSSRAWRAERWIGCCFFTRGTAAITPRTSPNCANKKVGMNLATSDWTAVAPPRRLVYHR